MWSAVTPRFSALNAATLLTPNQIEDGQTKWQNVAWELNRHFYDEGHPTANAFLAGSWGKGTVARPPRDIDLFFRLPIDRYYRYNNSLLNGQSALLQEVRGALQTPFPQTGIRADGQVVVVAFNTVTIEVIPYFALGDGRLLICDTNGGGRFKPAFPFEEIALIEFEDSGSNRTLRPLIRALKIWKRECNVPLKSFLLETLATNYLRQSPWRGQSFFYFDWHTRDFLLYLLKRANTLLTVAGGTTVFLGAEWQSRAETAYARAARACEFERVDLINEAGEEWQKIFGPMIPRFPPTQRLSLLP